MSPGDLFLRPGAWPILLLAPLAWLVLHAVDRRRSRRFARVVGPRAPALAADLRPGQRRLRNRLAAAALLLALLAVLEPAWGEGRRRLGPRGVDILVCLDVSRSMLARDQPPSRLASARREIGALAERLQEGRLGLVAFAGEARLVVPLTRDMKTYAELLARADPLSVRRGGTDLGAALAAALQALPGRGGRNETVLLLTDGEDLEGRGLAAAEACRQREIAVHCVGFGSAGGAKIALEGEGGEAFLRDRSGAEVVSAMDPAGLRRIAAATGGEFVAAAALPVPLVELYEKRILPRALAASAAGAGNGARTRFQWPLLGAFGLWILALCLTGRKLR